MGNFASCTMARTAGETQRARVVLPDGRVRQVALQATAAELMLEAPGNFLADASALRAGRRFQALPADEELQRGVLYAALPMKHLGTPVAPADVAGLAAFGVRAWRRRRSASSAAATAKVAAVVTPPRALRLAEMDVDDAEAAAEIEELKRRLSDGGRRSRWPTLETVQE